MGNDALLNDPFAAWVRNNWIYGGKVERSVLIGTQVELEAGEMVPEALLVGPDAVDLSVKFVELYHKHLRETFKL